MEFLNSLRKRSKHYNSPFDYWELNEPLTEEEIKEICIENGKVVDSVSDEASIVDAQGMVVMPGGIDIHCHSKLLEIELVLNI